MEDLCIICSSANNDDSITVKRGIDTLIQCSIQRKDGLADLFRTKTPVIVHKVCRRQYTHPTNIARLSHAASAINLDNTEDVSVLHLRSAERNFNFKRDCLFCAEEAYDKVRVKQPHKYRKVVYEVRKLKFKEKVLCRASERGDALGEAMITRLSNVINLVAVEARYHEECRLHFFLKVKFTNRGTNTRTARRC